MNEAPLRCLDRFADTAMRIKHRQERKAETRAVSRSDQPVGHLGRVFMGAPTGHVVDIMELADCRHAELEHLQIDQRRDGLIGRGREPVDQTVHLLSPGPKVILGPCPGDKLGPPCQCPLEGV